MHKNGVFMALAGAALLGVLILSNQSEPPELILGDRQIASRLPGAQDWPGTAPADAVSEAATRARIPAPAPDSDSPRVTAPPPPAQQVAAQQLAAQQLAARTQLVAKPGEMSRSNIVEMERMLIRLDLAISAPDGVVDDDTTLAIRLYQEIAGLPVDGEASQDLLTDMREVVKILDSEN